MEFICLAAGQGTRLGRLGEYLQKCMYPVGLKPFLEHTLGQLLASGLASEGDDRLVLVVGHHAEQVRGYFGREFDGLAIEYVEQLERRGTGQALELAWRHLRPAAGVIAWQADLFVTSDMFVNVAEHTSPTVVTLASGHEEEAPVLRATVEGGRVRRVWEGRGPLLDIGLWKLSSSALSGIGAEPAAGGEVRMLPNLQRCLDEGEEVGYVIAAEWVHLGGVLPTAEANVRQVVRRLFELTGEEE